MKKKVAKKTARRAPAARTVQIQQVIGYERLANGSSVITALGKDSKVYTWRGLAPCGWVISEFSEADLMQSVAANAPKTNAQTVENNAPVELKRRAAATASNKAATAPAFE